MIVNNNSYQLPTRIVWWDGDVTLSSSRVMADPTSIKKGVCVDRLTPEIIQYNSFADTPLVEKVEVRSPDVQWNLPTEYHQLDVLNYLIDKHNKIFGTCPLRLDRLLDELTLYVSRGLISMLKALIYITDKLQAAQQVWGIGRGSSVSSYVLHIIGTHDVDSYAYNLPITDFLR